PNSVTFNRRDFEFRARRVQRNRRRFWLGLGDRRVVEEETARYLEFAPDERVASGSAGASPSEPDGPSLFVALQQQLGLRLEAARLIAGPATDAPLLAGVINRFDGDFAEALVGIRLRVIRHGVRIAQILANVLERFDLLLPRLSEVGFAAGALRDALEHVARD